MQPTSSWNHLDTTLHTSHGATPPSHQPSGPPAPPRPLRCQVIELIITNLHTEGIGLLTSRL